MKLVSKCRARILLLNDIPFTTLRGTAFKQRWKNVVWRFLWISLQKRTSEEAILGLSKQSVNIAARAELAQYPVDTFIKIQAVKYLCRCFTNCDNPLLKDAFLLSKSLHLQGNYSWYSFIEHVCNTEDINLNELQNINFIQRKDALTKDIKDKLKNNYEEAFFKKLKSNTDKK